MKIILASQSPARAKLLRKIFPEFDIIPSHFDEGKIREKGPIEYVKKVAEAKVDEVARKTKEKALIIGADTVVAFRGKIVGKPKDREDAFRILSRLMGQKQAVITGFCLFNTQTGKKIVDFEKSVVKMRQVSPRKLWAYIDTGESQDKAGAYGVQGRADKFVEYIKGDFDNVVGLPVEKIKERVGEIVKWGAVLKMSSFL